MLPTYKFFLVVAFMGIYSSHIVAEEGPTSGFGAENAYAGTPYEHWSYSSSASSSSNSSNTSGSSSPVRG